ncbi:MAG TPA: 30S ribosomal protein S16 [Acidimicrobiales bacterium]|nr:30S ribosomal protein S16 [Acidimicrobiales bacterium]
MAVRLRLTRMGKKKQPTYRIVAADSRAPRDGRFLEIIGTYQPRLEPSGVKVDDAKALKWLRSGARPSETVEKLFRIAGTWEYFEAGTDPAPEVTEAASAPAAKQTKAPEPAESAGSGDSPEPADEAADSPEQAAEAAPAPAAEETGVEATETDTDADKAGDDQ